MEVGTVVHVFVRDVADHQKCAECAKKLYDYQYIYIGCRINPRQCRGSAPNAQISIGTTIFSRTRHNRTRSNP